MFFVIFKLANIYVAVTVMQSTFSLEFPLKEIPFILLLLMVEGPFAMFLVVIKYSIIGYFIIVVK